MDVSCSYIRFHQEWVGLLSDETINRFIGSLSWLSLRVEEKDSSQIVNFCQLYLLVYCHVFLF